MVKSVAKSVGKSVAKSVVKSVGEANVDTQGEKVGDQIVSNPSTWNKNTLYWLMKDQTGTEKEAGLSLEDLV